MSKAASQAAASQTSITRGLDFIDRVSRTKEGFDSYGKLLICCFALVGATSRDKSLRGLAKSRARELAQRWSRAHAVVPPDASAQMVLDFILVRYALNRLGFRDADLTSRIRSAAARFPVQDLLGFNPVSEPPPGDLPYNCECGRENPRGRTFCKPCRKRLQIQSRYGVWMRALAATYVSGRCGINFGVGYQEVLKWLPTLRPFSKAAGDDVELLRDAIYAVTHVVYALNDYGAYRLSPRLLPEEVDFLKANVASACEREDPEILGELLDSLKAFGLRATHPLLIRGTKYLLEAQNEDGSWGDPDEEDIRTRCHTTWTAIDGLRDYAWRGERKISRDLKAIMKR
ncbi:MAG: hypothetical protein QOE77_1984 [Blastocatellia bacterium]|jgi:hypothetical protein|nr:hypothetical protein [Blastocatellia bacterium]